MSVHYGGSSLCLTMPVIPLCQNRVYYNVPVQTVDSYEVIDCNACNYCRLLGYFKH